MSRSSALKMLTRSSWSVSLKARAAWCDSRTLMSLYSSARSLPALHRNPLSTSTPSSTTKKKQEQNERWKFHPPGIDARRPLLGPPSIRLQSDSDERKGIKNIQQDRIWIKYASCCAVNTKQVLRCQRHLWTRFDKHVRKWIFAHPHEQKQVGFSFLTTCLPRFARMIDVVDGGGDEAGGLVHGVQHGPDPLALQKIRRRLRTPKANKYL